MRLVWKEGYNRDRQVSQQQLESRYYFAVREFSSGRSGCVELRTSCTAWQFLNLSQPPLRRFVLFGTRLRRLAAKSTRPTRAMRRAAGAPIAHLIYPVNASRVYRYNGSDPQRPLGAASCPSYGLLRVHSAMLSIA